MYKRDFKLTFHHSIAPMELFIIFCFNRVSENDEMLITNFAVTFYFSGFGRAKYSSIRGGGFAAPATNGEFDWSRSKGERSFDQRSQAVGKSGKKISSGFLNVRSLEKHSNTSDNSFKDQKLFNFILKDHSNTTGQPMGSSK